MQFLVSVYGQIERAGKMYATSKKKTFTLFLREALADCGSQMPYRIDIGTLTLTGLNGT